MAWQRTSGSAEQEAPPSRLFLAASYVVLFIGGGVLGIYGALLLPLSLSPGISAPARTGTGVSAGQHILAASTTGGGLGQLISVGILFALVANPLLSLAGIWMAGTRLAAFTPLVGWMIVVLAMASGSSQGDSILPSDLRSIAYLLLGAISFIAVGTLSRPTRGMTAFPGLLATGPAATPPIRPPQKATPRRTAPKAKKRR